MKYDINSIKKAHHNTTYRGIDCVKSPFDYVIYQMIICEINPDLIIEIGTRMGGSALYMADLLEKLGDGIIHTIDINECESGLIINNTRIHTFSNGFENYNINLAKKYKNILVIDDGSHTYTDVKKSLNMFKDIISVGSYFIIEDSAIEFLGERIIEKFDGGPLKAIKEFLKDNDQFEIDRKWTNFYGDNVTFNTDGYLKKIK